MTRLGVVMAMVAAALVLPGTVAAQVGPACGAFDVVSAPDDGTGTDLRSVAALGTSNVWAVGQRWNAVGARDGFPLAMRWDGSTFVAEPIPDLSHLGTQPVLESVGIAPAGDPWVVGGLRDSGGRSLPLILRFLGGFWQTYPVASLDSFAPRFPRLRDVAAVDANDAWAVGEAETLIEGVREPFVAHWDGTAWSEVAMPGLVGGLRVVTAVAAFDKAVFAVGYDVPPDANKTSFARIYQWDGSVWSMVKHPALEKAGSTLQDVVVIAVDDIWAVGSVGSEGLLLHYDGARWSAFAAPASADPRSVTAVASNDVWAAGSRGDYRWDGKSWSFLPAASQAGTGERRAVAAAGPCDVWSIASTDVGAGSKSRVERLTRTIAPAPPATPIGFDAVPAPVAPFGPPAAPVSLTVKPGNRQIGVLWTPGNDPGPAGGTSFAIERCIGAGSDCLTRFVVIRKVASDVTAIVDSGLQPSTLYTYRVYAVNDAGASAPTAPATASTLASDPTQPGPRVVASTARIAVPLPPVADAPPATPVAFVAKGVSTKAIVLSWQPGGDPLGTVGQTEFVIERCVGAVGACVTRFTVIAKVAGTVTSFVDEAVRPGSTYTYRIYAVSGAGQSSRTAPVSAATLPDTSSPFPVPEGFTGSRS